MQLNSQHSCTIIWKGKTTLQLHSRSHRHMQSKTCEPLIYCIYCICNCVLFFLFSSFLTLPGVIREWIIDGEKAVSTVQRWDQKANSKPSCALSFLTPFSTSTEAHTCTHTHTHTLHSVTFKRQQGSQNKPIMICYYGCPQTICIGRWSRSILIGQWESDPNSSPLFITIWLRRLSESVTAPH